MRAIHSEPAPAPARASGATDGLLSTGARLVVREGAPGRPTTSGELFDPDGMTAAHRTLPLGAVVRVTNVENGRAVTLRINDRGPQDMSRIVDQSRAAAATLGFRDAGTARVRLERLSGTDP